MAEVDKWVCPDCGEIKDADLPHIPDHYSGNAKETCTHCLINFSESTKMNPVLKNDEV